MLSYHEINAIAPWSGAASWSPSAYLNDPAQSGNVNTGFPKGKAFADWLNAVGGSTRETFKNTLGHQRGKLVESSMMA